MKEFSLSLTLPPPPLVDGTPCEQTYPTHTQKDLLSSAFLETDRDFQIGEICLS